MPEESMFMNSREPLRGPSRLPGYSVSILIDLQFGKALYLYMATLD
jgi:hypothetical protein